jgi:uncharacterized protein YbjT (DUF2867 family)
MKTMKFKVIIFGATGMVGEGVLHESLLHADVESVLVVGRRSCQVSHPKLKEVIHSDMQNLTPVEQQLKGYDACYFCLGVSSIGKNESEYTRLTYDLTMNAATILSKLNPGMIFCYISGTGTDSTEKGRVMWARVKGKTENDLMKLPFKSVFAFRPGFIKPTRGLKNAFTLAKVIGLFYPALRIVFGSYICSLRDLGLAMIQVTTAGYTTKVIENVDIAKLARQNLGRS